METIKVTTEEAIKVNTEMATEIGLRESLVLEVIQGGARNTAEINEKLPFLSRKSITRYVKTLRENGYIADKSTYEETKERMFSEENNHAKKECEWCERSAFVLHDHHYPVPKREGGEQTVSICPSCHADFHFMEHWIK